MLTNKVFSARYWLTGGRQECSSFGKWLFATSGGRAGWEQCRDVAQRVCVLRSFVQSPSRDSRKADSNPRFVTVRSLNIFKREFENQLRFHRTHRPKFL